MSFVLNQTHTTQLYYPNLLVYVASADVTLDVTYAIETVSVTDTQGWARYSTAIGDNVSSTQREFGFTYSGSGSPVDEAEAALKALLTAE